MCILHTSVLKTFEITLFLMLVNTISVFGKQDQFVKLKQKSTSVTQNFNCVSFPKNFLFAASTSAYQIEGSWNLSGKGESIWDRTLHSSPNFTADGSTGDVACDSYHKYKDDVQLLKNVGFNIYRFSISWPRILPTGEPNNVNQEGIAYYKSLIYELLKNEIQPMVTLYHWDLPQKLQEMGGWLNPIIADYFEDYARIAFSSFGDQVKWWITINEPTEVVTGYSTEAYAPALDFKGGVAEYLAGHTLIRAHAKAYRLYERMFKPVQKGKVSFSMAGSFCMPKTNSSEDIMAAERWNQFVFGWFGNPVYSSSGGYPKLMRSIVDRRSALEGRTHSRLPMFSKEEEQYIKGSYDFLALNHYTSRLCSTGPSSFQPSWSNDVNVNCSFDPSWPGSASSWLKVVPSGFRKVLKWLKKSYNDVPVFVTENGYSEQNGLSDVLRINYHKAYLLEMLNAMKLDNCLVIGYTVWSLMDNFEWKQGYTERFGIYQVNFTDPNKQRIPRESVMFFKNLISSRTLH